LAAGALFVALNLWLQRGRLTYHGGALIEYLTPATAAGKSAPALLRVLASNLLSPVAVPVTVAAVVALVPAAWRARRPGVLRRLAAPESRTLYGLAAAVLVLSAILWPWHPWDVSQKWSLFLHALSAVMILRLLSDIAVWRWDLAETGGLRAWERAAWTVVPALLIVGLSAHAATQRRLHWNDVTAALRHLETVPLGPGSVSVAGHPYPTLRYLAEFGPFTGRLPYPAAFRPPHGDRAAIGPETRYIISYERPGTLARGYPGYTFEAEPSWPAHLYRVGTAPGR
jgi:hypothetical protein